MVTFNELNQQNDKITELSNVLNYLINERALCDTTITQQLFFTYVEIVKEHLALEERELYQKLLISREASVHNTADKFLAGSAEIKRVFNQYLKHWCKHKQLYIKDYDQFVKDSQEMFALVLRRIEDEVEHLYPTVRRVYGQQMLN